jgi:hypothetical protein
MKDWFPLTDYEFYAYVAAGMFLIAAVDYSIAGEVLVHREEWTVVQVIFWIVVAYFAGHLISSPSAGLLEHLIARRILRTPAEVQLSTSPVVTIDRVMAWLFAQREYAPFTPIIRDCIREKAASALKRDSSSLDAETIFTVAYPISRRSADSVSRMNQFQNLYAVCRNISFVSIIATGLIGYRLYTNRDPHDVMLIVFCFLFAIGMFGRFLKFYAAFSAEVLRTFCAADFEK